VVDGTFLVLVPTLLVFVLGMAFVLRGVVNVGGARYQHKEYRLDEEAKKGKPGPDGRPRPPMNLN
jgi:hypothetical protein